MRLVPAGLTAWPGAVLERLERAPFTGGASRQTRHIVQTRRGRAYMSVRGVHRADGEDVARAAERALAALEGVHWAEVNPILAQVAVVFEDDTVGLDDLVGARAESASASPARALRWPTRWAGGVDASSAPVVAPPRNHGPAGGVPRLGRGRGYHRRADHRQGFQRMAR